MHQYWLPNARESVGDPMPYWFDDTFHLYYLVDEEHHGLFHGLGGHQWAHASTRDLVHWEHHPLAVPRGAAGDVDQYGICTGSIFHDDGQVYAFWATRTVEGDVTDRQSRRVTESLGYSTSPDGVHFTKYGGNPFLSPPPGYDGNFRDPFVFRDDQTGRYHLLVSACLDPALVAGRGGCLAQFVSDDLAHWRLAEPFLAPGRPGVPECPDLFEWHGWWYLTWLEAGWARYRRARSPHGPWLRPACDTFDGPGVNAAKTAPFGADRRIAVGFLHTKVGGTDLGGGSYAGRAVFREVFQQPDGTLTAGFVDEMVPATGDAIPLTFQPVHGQVWPQTGGVTLQSVDSLALAVADGLPVDGRVRLRLVPAGAPAHFGLVFRAEDHWRSGYELRFSPHERRVRLGRADHHAGREDFGVEGLDGPVDVDLVLYDDVLDVCLNGRRCLVERFGDRRGKRLFAWCENGELAVEQATAAPRR